MFSLDDFILNPPPPPPPPHPQPHETAAILVQVLCTPYNHAPCHFMQRHICKVYAWLAVTCPLHFWQNDQAILHATAVKQGWNGYRNKSQHRKSTQEKNILLLLLQGFKPTTFQSRVWCSDHWAIPTPWAVCVNIKIILIQDCTPPPPPPPTGLNENLPVHSILSNNREIPKGQK